MATYVYEADIEWVEDEWVVTPQAFPGCFGGGASIQKACENASIALKLFIAEYIDKGKALPQATFHNPPRCILCVDVDEVLIEETRVDAVSYTACELCPEGKTAMKPEISVRHSS